MRIVVMGSGGTGGYFGSKLARAGEDVTFVARGAHREAIQAHGLKVRSAVEGEWVVRAPVVERLEGLRPADMVLFCVKSYDTEASAELIRPVVGRDTGVVSVQNGVSNEEVLARLLGAEHVVGGVARVFSTIESPGVIAHTLLGELDFGEMDGHESPRARAFLTACRGAGIAAQLSDRIRSALWEKYVFLGAHSAMTALTRQPTGVLRELPETRRLYRLLLEEMAALARAEKAGLDEEIVNRVMKALDSMGAGALTSLYHDLIRGKRLELEALQGHAVRLGEQHGIATPMLFAAYALLRPHRDGAPASA